MTPKIAIIIGSKSDFPIVKNATDILDSLKINYSVNIYSAHRTPNELDEYIRKNGFKDFNELKGAIQND